jgi:hypothetical protein
MTKVTPFQHDEGVLDANVHKIDTKLLHDTKREEMDYRQLKFPPMRFKNAEIENEFCEYYYGSKE